MPCCNARHGHLRCLMNVQPETEMSRRRFVNSLRPELSLQHQSTRRSRTAQSCPIRSLVQCGEVRSGQSIAVGTRLTPGPPRRSVLARLSHTAPALGCDEIQVRDEVAYRPALGAVCGRGHFARWIRQLCPKRVSLVRISLGQRPSLHCLRGTRLCSATSRVI